MKRTIGITIMLLAVAILVTGIGIWQNHNLKIKNAEPVNVYKDTPFQPDNSPKDTTEKQKKSVKSTPVELDNLPKDTSPKSDDNRDVEIGSRETTQPIDTFTPEETESLGNLTVHPIFSDIIVENLPPKAAAALKEYDESRLAADALTSELTPLLKARPIDIDAINPLTEQLMQLNQQRFDALEILALYSDKASNQLEALKGPKKETDRIIAETKKDMQELRKTIEDIGKEIDLGNELEESLK